jgi:uncharacterized protein
MRSIFLCLVVIVSALFAGVALAQEEPLMGSEAVAGPAQTANPLAADPVAVDDVTGVYRILVVGDGLAGGLGNGMIRMAEADPRFEILNRFNESSGLARPEVYDWAQAIPKIVENAPIDAVVVLVGLNDRQGIRDGNARYVFKSPEWVKAYEASIDRVLGSAKQAGAKVFWVSLPPMANTVFDADMRYLNDLHRARVAAVGGHYVDVRPFFVGPDGAYVDRGLDETGNDRKLRERDGVKFMKVGNNKFGQLVLGAVKALEASATGPVVAAAPVTSTPATVPVRALPPGSITVVPMPPSFGQTGLEGEDLTFRADVVKPLVKPPVSVAVRSAIEANGKIETITLRALAGSQAQQLFEKGLVSSAPPGRFDDFSVPPLK